MKTVTLNDKTRFEFLNGLWTGKKPPFEKAVVVRNTNFRNDGVLDLSDAAVLDVEAKQLEKRKLQDGDIIIERSGGGPKQAVGRVCYFNAKGPLPFSFSNFTSTLRVKDQKSFLPRFVHYYLLHLYHDGFTIPLQRATTGIRNLDFDAYVNAQVPAMPYEKQEKITALLLKIQNTIELEDKLITTTRELKKSAMQRFFKHGLRNELQKETEIGQIPNSWSIRSFERLREFLQYGTSAKCDYHGKGNPVVRIPNVVDGKIIFDDLKWCELSERETKSLTLLPGDILFIRTNGVRARVGTCAVYQGHPDRALFASYLIRARLNQSELNPKFFQYFTMTPAGAAQLSDRSSAAADGKFNINMKTIDSIYVPIPSSLDEQREIVRILEAIDLKIAIHERKRIVLENLFKTLLCELMTDQICVTNLNIDTSEVKN